MWILQKLIKADNSESLFGNEGQDIKRQTLFTTNNKQYTVIITSDTINVLMAKNFPTPPVNRIYLLAPWVTYLSLPSTLQFNG